ncbi:MAG: molecular chaperone DnaJ [Bryobacterales bacterium]|nr:molecular chaperone DnaJ [Bryobacterales bacterium]
MPGTDQKDHYKTLGVPKNASADQIRKAYRRLARKYHPDVNPGDSSAEEKFKSIQEAYGILGDQKKRELYDQYGFYSEPGAYPGSRGHGPGGFDFSGFDFSDFARAAGGKAAGSNRGRPWGGGFSDLFSQFFRQDQEQTAAQAQPGEDLEYSVDIDFWDAIKGAKLRLNVARHEPCPQCRGMGNIGQGTIACKQCQGSGQVSQTVGAMRFNLACPRCQGSGQLRDVCPRCSGEGRLHRTETVEVRIPPGVQNGSRLRVPGKGNAGQRGGAAGDLYIITRVGSHSVFERKGDDIHVRVPITIPEAILGGSIEVPTIAGKARLKIPPATSSGKRFRLREKGVLNPRTNRKGDQFVEVKIVVPEVPDEGSKAMMKEFANLNPEDPRNGLFE